MWKGCLNSFVMGFVTGFILVFLAFKVHRVTIGRRETMHSFYPDLEAVGPPSHSNFGEPVTSQSVTSVNRSDKDIPNLHCSNSTIEFLILVLSTPKGVARRTVIRDTWMKDPTSKLVKVTVKFVIGILGLHNNKTFSLRQEQKKYGDLLFLPELKDSYSNLTLKMKFGLIWVDKNISDFDYLIKTDDDTYVRVDSIEKAIRELNCEDQLHMGFFFGTSRPHKSGRWAEKKWLKCPCYLPYPSGGGYIISRKVLKVAMRYPSRLSMYTCEDVTVGSWLAPYHMVRKHDVRFNVELWSHGCINTMLISHQDKPSPSYFYDKHKRIVLNQGMCKKEEEKVSVYEYNWAVSPANCCKRVKGIFLKAGQHIKTLNLSII